MKYLKIITYKGKDIQQKVVSLSSYNQFWFSRLNELKERNIIDDFDVKNYCEQLELF